MKTVKIFLAALFISLLPLTPDAAEIALGAGAGLKDVLNELSSDFSASAHGVKFTKNFAASGVLAKQMENGLPLDVVFVANVEWMDYMKEKKLVDPTTADSFAFNTLVFAGLPGAVNVHSMNDLLKLERIAIGSPKTVPAGDYALHAIRKSGIEKELEKKLIMARDVRDCLMYAERGEADGAFVYKTDVMMAKRAKILFSVPKELYPRVVYLMAVTASGKEKPEAVGFYNFLKSEKALNVLKKYGFETK